MKKKAHPLRTAIIVATIGAVGAIVAGGIGASIQASSQGKMAAKRNEVQGSYSADRRKNEQVMSESLKATFSAMASFADAEIAQGRATAANCRKASPQSAQEAQQQLEEAEKGVDSFKGRNGGIAKSFADLLGKQGEFETLVEANRLHEAAAILPNIQATSSSLQQVVAEQTKQLQHFISMSNQLNALSARCR